VEASAEQLVETNAEENWSQHYFAFYFFFVSFQSENILCCALSFHLYVKNVTWTGEVFRIWDFLFCNLLKGFREHDVNFV
jgi:hypothetical protein